MPIKQILTYEPKITELDRDSEKVGKQVVDLLRQVRTEIGQLDNAFADKSLKQVLEAVEKGKYVFRDGKVRTEIDLSSVDSLIKCYRYHSERGCQSCEHERVYQPNLPGEDYRYCGKYENEKMDNLTGMSERVRQFSEKGCDERKAIFRPLEEVLAGTY